MKLPITPFLDSFRVGDHSDRITPFTFAVLTGRASQIAVYGRLLSRIPLAQKLRFEPAVAELFQEANPLNRAGTPLNEDLIPRIIESKEKQSV